MAAGKAGIEGVRAPRELRHTCISVMSESGAENVVITWVTRHFSSRVTKTTYPRELRPVIIADAGVMERISFSRLLLYAVHNHIGTLGHGRFRRKLAVFGPVTLSIELGCVYPH
jgi:hypothetical protein